MCWSTTPALPPSPTVPTDDGGGVRRHVRVNVKAPFFLTAALAPQMAAKGGGSIINISSMAATIGMNGIGSLWRVQGCIEPLTKAWTAEYAAADVRVNTVAPGPTLHPGSRARWRWFDEFASSTFRPPRR